MQNKPLKYLLFVAVAIIWYMVFFRVKNNLFGEEIVVVKPISQIESFRPENRDTVELKANYRDPFGLTQSKQEKKNTLKGDHVINNMLKPIKKHSPPFIWPKIKYLGMVKKSQAKSALAILTIDGIQLMARTGEELFDGIIIKDIKRDSLLLKYKSKLQYFKR